MSEFERKLRNRPALLKQQQDAKTLAEIEESRRKMVEREQVMRDAEIVRSKKRGEMIERAKSVMADIDSTYGIRRKVETFAKVVGGDRVFEEPISEVCGNYVMSELHFVYQSRRGSICSPHFIKTGSHWATGAGETGAYGSVDEGYTAYRFSSPQELEDNVNISLVAGEDIERYCIGNNHGGPIKPGVAVKFGGNEWNLLKKRLFGPPGYSSSPSSIGHVIIFIDSDPNKISQLIEDGFMRLYDHVNYCIDHKK